MHYLAVWACLIIQFSKLNNPLATLIILKKYVTDDIRLDMFMLLTLAQRIKYSHCKYT